MAVIRRKNYKECKYCGAKFKAAPYGNATMCTTCRGLKRKWNRMQDEIPLFMPLEEKRLYVKLRDMFGYDHLTDEEVERRRRLGWIK